METRQKKRPITEVMGLFIDFVALKLMQRYQAISSQ